MKDLVVIIFCLIGIAIGVWYAVRTQSRPQIKTVRRFRRFRKPN
jgi:uncharacterized membrane protein